MMDRLERGGVLAGLAFGVAASIYVFSLPNPENITALRVLGSPLLFVVGFLTLVVPTAGVLYYFVVAAQWTLLGWLGGFLLARRRRIRSSVPGT